MTVKAITWEQVIDAYTFINKIIKENFLYKEKNITPENFYMVDRNESIYKDKNIKGIIYFQDSTSYFIKYGDVLKEVKIYKPHPNVYNIPIKKYRIEKNQFAYLSSNTWDVSAAGNFGFNAVWVNRNKNIFDNLDYKPITEINNLSDLNNLL